MCKLAFAVLALALALGAVDAFVHGPASGIPAAASLRKAVCAPRVLVCQWGGGGGRDGGGGGGWGGERRERGSRGSFGGDRDRRGRGGGGGGGGGGGREERAPRNDRFKEYARGDDGEKVVENVPKIMELLERRERARRNRDFAAADDLRDELLFSLGVHVDDKSRPPKFPTVSLSSVHSQAMSHGIAAPIDAHLRRIPPCHPLLRTVHPYRTARGPPDLDRPAAFRKFRAAA